MKGWWRHLVAVLLLAIAVMGIYQVGYRSADRAWQLKWAERDAGEAEAIANNLIWTLDIFRTAQEANRHDKDEITLDAQATATVITHYVEDDNCAVRTVPDAADQRLREYADRLRYGSP
ncbi:DUF2514 family protein [Klebsiella oxytoca]|uniref:DUF2514 family protein n=1 Tax=Klebsiella oxytoca TaxID=571 RepID=UPI001CCB01A4|nr:DUF2514 family protein [Klebsiella oxytoca]MBZ7262468.1 DUF2514 family protein [Klebsiella oxytoca]